MKLKRPLVLAASALALFVAACSTPADLAAPGLEPQFGTADNDVGVDVTTTSSGETYSLSERSGFTYDEFGDRDGVLERALLRKYNSSGALLWTREVASENCRYINDCDQDPLQARALATDTRGVSYVLVSKHFTTMDAAVVIPFYVYRYDAAGNLLGSVRIGSNGQPFCSSTGTYSDAADIGTDRDGNFYVVRQNATFSEDFCDADYTNIVAKYSPSGTLRWQRLSTVGALSGISIPTNNDYFGQVYVAGAGGVARYSYEGGFNWAKSGAAQDVVAVGTNAVYARNLTTVRKLDASGRQLWSRAQGGLNGMVVGDMAVDSSANVYLTGKYSASSGNRDVFTRKLGSSGATLWTKTFGTSSYDDARGVATLNGSDIYITGATQGSLVHPFRGGENDGYVRKLSSSGNPVWTR